MRLVAGIAILLFAGLIASDSKTHLGPGVSAPSDSSSEATRLAGGRHSLSASPDQRSFIYKTVGSVELAMVIDYPPGWKASDKRPAIIFFFSGAWSEGNLKEFAVQARYLAERGMVAARADYRVGSRERVTPRECVEDAKSAVRWLRTNAGVLGIDPDRIVAAGGSAGGHLAACATLSPGLDAQGEDTAVSCRGNAMVLYNPVLDFTSTMFAWRIGKNASLARVLSPTLQLKKDSPPTLLLFGSEDYLFPQVEAFMARSRALDHRAELYVAPGRPHGFYARGKWKDLTTVRVAAFLQSLGYLQECPQAPAP